MDGRWLDRWLVALPLVGFSVAVQAWAVSGPVALATARAAYQTSVGPLTVISRAVPVVLWTAPMLWVGLRTLAG